ncbi:PAS domain S-box protein [Deinococcus sp. KSM4-11]|uniref:PAS domain S-box protein n=1 Tax=Deinococcus sp. KSM4-11 TaxID=2568654 RepID=UPI0010A3B637|nr:HD domain-containing phosphohydrolase [Deinococcus sp. KSM4-11]THF84351.1 PAS domain S-box protein [Deinococcus sp. KSM4-11]
MVTVSAACERILGYAPAELIGRSFLEFVHPDDRITTSDEGTRIASKGRAGQIGMTVVHNRYIHKEGHEVWIEWNAVAVPNDAVLYCVARDITERRAAQEDQAFLAAIVHASHDAILGVTLDGFIRSWNAGAEELYGYRAEEAVGQLMNLIVPAELGAEEEVMLRRIGKGERVPPFESVRKAKDGHLIPVFITASPILAPDGRVVGASKIAQDISARQAAARQIEALNDGLERQLIHVSNMRKIDQTIASGGDLTATLGLILENILKQLSADAATALILNPYTLTLEYAATRGLHATALHGSAVKLDQGPAGQVALSRHPLTVPDLRTVLLAPDWHDLLRREGVTSYYAAPLIARGQVLGVIEVLHQRTFVPSSQWLETIEALIGQAAIAVENALLFQELEHRNMELRLAYDETIEGWARALDLRDKETEGHSRRVTELTVELCQHLGLPPEQIVQVRRGALLHDIGKMGIRDAILLKPGKLDDDEWAQMKRHPSFAVELLSPITFLQPALDIPRHHHEKWDGSGYPHGLKDTAIPLTARAFAVVDVYDALTSDRPYRPAWTREQAIQHILNSAGTHFDPQVVQVFIAMLEQT